MGTAIRQLGFVGNQVGHPVANAELDLTTGTGEVSLFVGERGFACRVDRAAKPGKCMGRDQVESP